VAALTFAAFPATPLSLGLVCDFVSRFPPFDGFEFRQMTVTLRHQLDTRCNMVAGHDDEIVAYLGWIRTTHEIVEAWMKDQGPLTAVAENASAVAITVLVASDRKYVLPLIRQAKAENPDISVYWKRQFADGTEAAKRSVRKGAD
jgi:hypothetical protein